MWHVAELELLTPENREQKGYQGKKYTYWT